jgi:hypothetical protein
MDPTMRTVFKTTPSTNPQSAQKESTSKEVIKKKKDKDARCGHCDGCRSKMMGKKGKCEKRSSSKKNIKEKLKEKEGRVK